MIWLRGGLFTLVSPHTPEECAARLRDVIAPDTGFKAAFALFSGKPLVGVANASEVRLRKLNSRRNFMQPELTATLEPYGSGTRLDCRIRLTIASLILVALCVAAFTLVGCCVSISAIAALTRGEVPPERTWVVPLSAGFVIAFVLYGRSMARGEREFLETTLIERLNGWRE